MNKDINETGLEIAVIGMAGRFPGADNIDEFWENLVKGVESVTFGSEKEMVEFGVESKSLKKPEYIKQALVVKKCEYFDASFFEYTPKETQAMDPQIRVFHECAWNALEDAGYNPHHFAKPIGCYAGASGNFMWEALTYLTRSQAEDVSFDFKFLNDKDYLSSRVAHKLNLRGPAVSVNTACSTSLVAIHMACQGLLSGECAIAIAGGVTLSPGRREGYLYQEGMILSPDGHCRAFDARADGTIFGDGIGVVVLKPLEDAVRDNDNIHAVIKGSYVNNDGKRRAAYTAPGIEGQASVIRTAHRIAEVDPETITYVETHGAGTALGDPIEFEGLKLAFNSSKKQFCRLGSVKTNVGHLNIAAGVTGFIKTVLALKNKLLPPSLHYESPNPKIDFENSPFYVTSQLSKWEKSASPLRAGVSAFGIGGTNAHVILEEAPMIAASLNGPPDGAAWDREYSLLMLSARDEAALHRMTGNLARHLRDNSDLNLGDIAYTLQMGRGHFEYKKMLVCRDVEEAIRILSAEDSRKAHNFFSRYNNDSIVFMFAGLGSQYENMGLELYRKEHVFRENMDQCFAFLETMLDYDLKGILFPGLKPQNSGQSSAGAHQIDDPEISQLVIFIFEYSLARMLMRWGIRPKVMIGYSFGEYATACLAGVFSLEDALKLIVARGKLIMALPAGLMVSVPLTVAELNPFINDELSIAIDNGSSCIVSGPTAAVVTFEKEMKSKRLMCMRLEYASRAIHSKMMAPILDKFAALVADITLNSPTIPFISNVTGKWATDEVKEPEYWSRQLRETVQFSAGIEELIQDKTAVFVEIGPGRDICTMIQRYTENNPAQHVLNLVRPSQKEISDMSFLLNKIGQLWLYGAEIDWQEFYYGHKRQRLSLPSYPFEGRRFMAEGNPFKIGADLLQSSSSPQKRENSDWFYLPSWKPSMLPIPQSEENSGPDSPVSPVAWLVFLDQVGVGNELVKQLQAEGHDIIIVKMADRFCRENTDTFTINPKEENDYHTLLKELCLLKIETRQILHLWSVKDNDQKFSPFEWLEICQDLGYYSLIFLAQAIQEQGIENEIQISVISNNMQGIYGEDLLYPEKAILLGPVNVIPKEYTNISCRSLDITLATAGSLHWKKIIRQLLKELNTKVSDTVVSYHGGPRLVQSFEPIKMIKPTGEAPRLREKGVYLLTGGLGAIGLLQSEYLAKRVGAKIVLLGRSAFPPRHQWEHYLLDHQNQEEDTISLKIKKLLEIEKSGGDIMICSADVSSSEQMAEVVQSAERQFGPINGVIHNALQIDGGVIHLLTREKSQNVFASKVIGTMVLDTIFNNHDLDFFVLTSSTASIMMTIGHTVYGGASAFLDAFAQHKACSGNDAVMTINWAAWAEVGGAFELAKKHRESLGVSEPTPLALNSGILSADGMDAFSRIMESRTLCPTTQVVVYPEDLNDHITQSKRRQSQSLAEPSQAPIEKYQRPQLNSEYMAATDDVQQTLVNTWQDFFGFQQVGIQDDFFELGGDSLKAILMTSLIEKKMHVKVSIATIFETLTIEELAKYITGNAEKSTFSAINPVEKREYYPISSAQKRLFVLQQMEPENQSYNRLNTIVLEGKVDKEKLEETFLKLIQRHESLRTSFELVNGEPVQRIHNDIDFQIEYIDLDKIATKGQENPKEKEQRVVTDLSAHLLRPFNLSRASLIRVAMIRTCHTLAESNLLSQEKVVSGQEIHILLYAVHHIIIDGTSMAIFRSDFVALGDGKTLPPLRIQYKEYSAWQNDKERINLLEKQEKYWLNTFSGSLPVLHLPIDFKRPPQQSFEGDTIIFELDSEETETLKNITKETDATLYMVLFSLFTLLVSKLSGQEEVIVGTPTTGRAHADLDGIIGLFVNILPIRSFPGGAKTFREFVQEVKMNMLDAFSNQDYQFDDLVDSMLKKRDPSRNPIFDVVFNMLNYRDVTVETDEMVSDSKDMGYNYIGKTAQFDINLLAIEQGKKILFKLEYCTKLFKLETIERFVEYFKTIVSSLAPTIDRKLSDIEMISQQEQDEFLTITPIVRN
jgi:acyl transferase domain-containing protein/acyl carrier protein